MTGEANRAQLYAAARGALSADPTVLAHGINVTYLPLRTIRLLCPRGHFVTNLVVVELLEGLALALPFAKDRLLIGDDFSEFIEDAFLVHRHGPPPPTSEPSRWIRQTGDRIGVYAQQSVAMECVNGKCSYSGSFDYAALARTVHRAAVAGHDEYQLTN